MRSFFLTNFPLVIIYSQFAHWTKSKNGVKMEILTKKQLAEKTGQIIKSLRKKSRLSLKKAANKLGPYFPRKKIHFTTINGWEKGRNLIDLDKLLIICQVYGVSIIAIFKRIGLVKKIKSTDTDEELSDFLSRFHGIYDLLPSKRKKELIGGMLKIVKFLEWGELQT